jgi:uncharacterized repeat protein (TIGR03803 family)
MNRNNQSSPRCAGISQYGKMFPMRLPLLLILAMLACNAFGQTLTTLYSFGAAKLDGQAPGSGVILDKNGNLFGTTGTGGAQRSLGTVFELSPPTNGSVAWTETVLHRFHGAPDGGIVESPIVMDSSGNLFGSTLRGGTDNLGIAYMVTPPVGDAASKKRTIHNFGTVPDDVVGPSFGFFLAPEGLYGVDEGGANNTGALYLLTAPERGNSWTQHILYSFQPFQSGDGAFPSGGLVRDSNGNFYGVTGQGGVNNLGAVYEISPPAVAGGVWTETVLFSFDGTHGNIPEGALLIGAGGVLYGTTAAGGDSGFGFVYELDPPSVAGSPWTETVLHAFTGGVDGISPESGVIMDKKGRLLGEAGNTIFRLTPSRTAGKPWKETVLHTFTGPDGLVATGPLTLSNNVVYGTTAEGGAFGIGTVFQLTLP